MDTARKLSYLGREKLPLPREGKDLVVAPALVTGRQAAGEINLDALFATEGPLR